MASGTGAPLVAIVGGGTLLGREVRDVLAGAGLAVRTKLIGADPVETGALTEQDGEPVIMTALDADNLAGASVVVLAGSAAASRQAFEMLSRSARPPALIDLTHTFEDHPRARLRAPQVEAPGEPAGPEAVHVIAHPAAIALALFYTRLHAAAPFRRSIAHVFEPASERGQAGLDELKDQTVSLLTFKRIPHAVFDEQLGFNLLARYGSEAPVSLQSVENRLERHLASLLGPAAIPLPSLRLVQAPVFHGHSFSLWVEFEENPGASALEKALAGSALLDVRGSEVEAPTNVGCAGQSGLAVGAIAADPAQPRACWFWVVADNLRLAAENAVAVLRSLLAAPTP